jgi:putative hydrolase of the HAD superfamily
MLMTKGNINEQAGKIERSGLKEYFAVVEIVSEKDVATYSRLTEKYALAPASTWMIGNSPRSDINPALRAGLNAVFVPHHHTWILEHEEILEYDGPGRLVIVAQFADLVKHF